jgi:hypothetical protein
MRIGWPALPTDDERVRANARGIRRTMGTAKTKKAPATNDRLMAMVAPRDCSLAAFRDRARSKTKFAAAHDEKPAECIKFDSANRPNTTA